MPAIRTCITANVGLAANLSWNSWAPVTPLCDAKAYIPGNAEVNTTNPNPTDATIRKMRMVRL